MGSEIVYCGEEGVVVHVDPLVMQTTLFHSYVPVTRVDAIVSTGRVVTDARPLPPMVLGRIVAYLERDATPTGAL